MSKATVVRDCSVTLKLFHGGSFSRKDSGGGGRGRPRSTHVPDQPASTAMPPSSSQQLEAHHDITAQPTRTGRGGRVIKTARGGGAAGRRGGRGPAGNQGRGRGRPPRATGAPTGLGVLFDDHGNIFTNDPGSTSGPRSIVSGPDVATTTPSTQASVNI
ncbi:hypothetical protein RND81_13G125300 [Saponaria officinalis]|uniref:Uncharacterized protein n=1 Tax=Saponaria officinalis TaxID=3572 RepID=A0AAW1H2N2_SAPOF